MNPPLRAPALAAVTAELVKAVEELRFGPPVAEVYNPLVYAAAPYRDYLTRYGRAPKEIVLIGMNPGPWGMAQTGVPFGEVGAVRDWMGIEAPVGRPRRLHPKRPVMGFDCRRAEVSGRRLWGWAQHCFGTAEAFFRRFFVANYCPLMFIEASGANRTPDKLNPHQARLLFAACDRALRLTVECLKPAVVVGIGRFAAERARLALEGTDVACGVATHPSPANPRANRGWEDLFRCELRALGIRM
jgi:single-strand selective monofunctional uracil DNA glycosylase